MKKIPRSYRWRPLVVFFIVLLSDLVGASAAPVPQKIAPWLLPGAPTFDMTISQFRKSFNAANPDLPVNEFRAINTHGEKSPFIRAATKINETLYASAALEYGTGKIKTLQFTWLPVPGPDEMVSWKQAQAYMAALLRFFSPMQSKPESISQINALLSRGKSAHHYAQTEGALRFVVVDRDGKEVTFAAEPVKLVLPLPLTPLQK